jgi:catechol 2,3-dioxygenase-like lactoylglutathione lyase family enzyme
MTHGTLECDDKPASQRFYNDVLGLEIAGGGKHSTYIKHPSTPWYIVSLPVRKRSYLSPANRFTLRLESPDAVREAYEEFSLSGEELGITQLQDLTEQGETVSFIFRDLDRNWWEAQASEIAEPQLLAGCGKTDFYASTSSA